MRVMRLLLLGLLATRSMHGYDVRRELQTWNAERWVRIAYGSIYFGLRQLAREGLLEVVVGRDDDGVLRLGPARTVYRITPRGRMEFERLLRELWWEPRPPIDPFQVALTFMDRLPRDELLAVLRHRGELLQADLNELAEAERVKLVHPDTPRHISENLRLVSVRATAELHWLQELLTKVEHGDLP